MIPGTTSNEAFSISGMPFHCTSPSFSEEARTTTTRGGKKLDATRSELAAMASVRRKFKASTAGKMVGWVPSRFIRSGKSTARAKKAQSWSRWLAVGNMVGNWHFLCRVISETEL